MAKGNSSGGSGSQSRVITLEELMRTNPFPTLVLRSHQTTEATAGPRNQDQGGQQFSQLMVRLLYVIELELKSC